MVVTIILVTFAKLVTIVTLVTLVTKVTLSQFQSFLKYLYSKTDTTVMLIFVLIWKNAQKWQFIKSSLLGLCSIPIFSPKHSTQLAILVIYTDIGHYYCQFPLSTITWRDSSKGLWLLKSTIKSLQSINSGFEREREIIRQLENEEFSLTSQFHVFLLVQIPKEFTHDIR